MAWGDLGGPIVAACGALVLVVTVGPAPPATRSVSEFAVPVLEPQSAYAFKELPAGMGRLRVRSTHGGAVQVAMGADGEFEPMADVVDLVVGPDLRSAAKALATPISLNWRHPLAGLPAAQVLRVAETDERGRRGPERQHTLLFVDHGPLPIVSLVLPSASLFDPDSGLMVVGNGIFHAPLKVLTTEYRDPRWWKYPGNFHMRGKHWQRKAGIQLIDEHGQEVFQAKVGVRINGQMTRAFPQHALRLNFQDPLRVDLFGEHVGSGYDALVLRTAGNDQIKAMLRDPLQHALCAGLPFELSAHRTCVVYINGAYWGVHHLRHRMDEQEIARRYDIKAKHITILEDEARFYRGDSQLVTEFERLASITKDWDGLDPAWRDSLQARLDVDGFMSYMATQMILGNMDWPNQNVKFWRYTGPLRAEPPLDGRWYFIMGDSDLGFGVHADAAADMFKQVKAYDVPIIRLFKGILRNAEWRAQFIATARALARDRFSAEKCTARLDQMVSLMAPEMERHTARWRRPADTEAWMQNVRIMRTFAAQRSDHVLEQLDRFEKRGPGSW